MFRAPLSSRREETSRLFLNAKIHFSLRIDFIDRFSFVHAILGVLDPGS